VIGAVALQCPLGFLHDSAGEQFARDLTDIDIRDLPVIAVDVR
jgi:hypothetical protein